MTRLRSSLLRLCVVLMCCCVDLPAFAHEEDEGPAGSVDRRITTTSNILAAGAAILVLGMGGYVFLAKRGIIKSKANDRWE